LRIVGHVDVQALKEERVGRGRGGFVVIVLLSHAVSGSLLRCRFTFTAVGWLCGGDNSRDSFFIFKDNCLTAAAYGTFFGTAVIAWNGVSRGGGWREE
jgi:hypothetical protein